MSRILIVDDNRANRDLLEAQLEGLGHELILADSGERAIAIAAELKPDLVLLDVMMPGLNGFDTARRIKQQQPPDAFVPIILVSALNDPTSRLVGLRVGADEFLSKPVDSIELQVRIRNLLELQAKGRALAQQNATLASLQRFKDDLTKLLFHDLKGPLTTIIASSDEAIDMLSPGSEEVVEALADVRDAGWQLDRLLGNLLDITRLEDQRLELHRQTIDLSELLHKMARQWQRVASQRGISITVTAPAMARVAIDGETIRRVIANILDNALRFVPAKGRIVMALEVSEELVRLRIGNTGEPVPLSARSRVFEKYGQHGEGIQRMNLGLGLYFCRIAVEAHGGRIAIEESPELPTVFAIDVPL